LKNRSPFARLREPANVLILQDLNAANICYKLLAGIGGAQAIGPILVGMARPIHLLQRGSDVSNLVDIVNIPVIAAIDAQERARRAAGAA
jgi:malate dehydrogenase (oxaloacetate-decarboxylating)(NADP+)